MADTRTSTSRRAAANSGGTRLPSARERRPALAALAVLLIVGGAFASGFLALQAGDRADYLRVNVNVPQGTKITADQLETVSLPEDLDGVISADDKDDVVGQWTATTLVEGTILNEDMVMEEAGVDAGVVEVTFGVDSSSIAPDLPPGTWVRVFAVPDEGGTGSYDARLVSADYPDEDSGIGGDSSATVQVKVLMSDQDAEDLQPAIEDESVSSVSRIAPPETESDDE
jgi:SAF domain